MHDIAHLRRVNAPRPHFQKRHYRTLAEAIASVRALPYGSNDPLGDLVERLCDVFKDDSADFRADQFRAACRNECNGLVP